MKMRQLIRKYNQSIRNSYNVLFFLRWCSPPPPLPSPSTLKFLKYCTLILQRPRIFVGYAGFEPRTSAPGIFFSLRILNFSRGSTSFLVTLAVIYVDLNNYDQNNDAVLCLKIPLVENLKK